jgi:hypothetical protein
MSRAGVCMHKSVQQASRLAVLAQLVEQSTIDPKFKGSIPGF